MNLHTKLVDQNQATRRTIGGKKGWKIPMARFHGGKFGTETIRVKPVGWRSRFPGYEKWSFPYLVGSKVEFEMELVDTTSKLFNFPFYVVNTSSKSERIPLDSAKHKDKMVMNWYSTPADGALQIWLGSPEGPDAINIVYADTWNPTNTVIAVITAIATLIFREFVVWLMGLF